MKKFKFRLEKVLHFRNLVKEEKKRLLYEATRMLNEATLHLEFLREEFLKNSIEDGQIYLAEELLRRSQYSQRLKRLSELQLLKIMECEKAVEEAKQNYIEANKEYEILEKLKERKKEQFDEYVKHEEDKTLDELVTQRGLTSIFIED